jgi:hypothetical protein
MPTAVTPIPSCILLLARVTGARQPRPRQRGCSCSARWPCSTPAPRDAPASRERTDGGEEAMSPSAIAPALPPCRGAEGGDGRSADGLRRQIQRAWWPDLTLPAAARRGEGSTTWGGGTFCRRGSVVATTGVWEAAMTRGRVRVAKGREREACRPSRPWRQVATARVESERSGSWDGREERETRE